MQSTRRFGYPVVHGAAMPAPEMLCTDTMYTGKKKHLRLVTWDFCFVHRNLDLTATPALAVHWLLLWRTRRVLWMDGRIQFCQWSPECI